MSKTIEKPDTICFLLFTALYEKKVSGFSPPLADQNPTYLADVSTISTPNQK